MKKYLGAWLVVFCMVMVFPAAKPQFVSAESLEYRTEAELDREKRELSRDIQDLLKIQEQMTQIVEKVPLLSDDVNRSIRRFIEVSKDTTNPEERQRRLTDACTYVRRAAKEEVDNLFKMNNLMKTYVKFMFDRSGFQTRKGVNKSEARKNILATLHASEMLFEDSYKIIELLSPQTIGEIQDSKKALQGVIANHKFVIEELGKVLVIPKPKSS